MVETLGQTIGFWSAFIAGFFILLHIPSCNKHWAYQLKPLSKYLARFHDQTLILATLFAIIHIFLSIIGLIFNIWIIKIRKNDFLIRLLENPNLLEHESFTEVLRAVFHIVEELEHRKNIKQLSKNDRSHMAGDIKRAYNLLVFEWLSYMRYLKDNYPYLFSLAMRLNPFDENATAEIK